MRLFPVFGTFAAMIVTSVAFQNCTKANFAPNTVESSLGENANNGGGGGNGGMGGGGGQGGENVEVISQKCISTGIKRFTKRISFPTPANIPGTDSACDWGNNLNLAPRNGYIQARSEQYVELELPAASTVCGMKFAFESSNMVYDDEIILTYKNIVLATSYRELLELMPSRNNIGSYNWGTLLGRSSNVSGYEPFCAGQSEGLASCSMPRTQETGTIRIVIDDEIFHRIAAQYPSAPQRLGLITTGDDDRTSDCKHAPVAFDVEVVYY